MGILANSLGQERSQATWKESELLNFNHIHSHNHIQPVQKWRHLARGEVLRIGASSRGQISGLLNLDQHQLLVATARGMRGGEGTGSLVHPFFKLFSTALTIKLMAQDQDELDFACC